MVPRFLDIDGVVTSGKLDIFWTSIQLSYGSILGLPGLHVQPLRRVRGHIFHSTGTRLVAATGPSCWWWIVGPAQPLVALVVRACDKTKVAPGKNDKCVGMT
jgi:hypothetical protein